MATYNPAPIPESGADPRSQLDPANPGAQQNITSGLDANPSGRVAAHDQGNTAPIGSGAGGTAALAGHAQSQPAPPSQVADVDYPNVPERAEPQQAATGPGTGGIVEQDKIPFKEQVNGYAKKFAGTIFNKPEEKEFGEKKLRGEA
ncbi:hypothetical protein DB88DRAFT_512041 [Papiliotrema laurentii]|uniref:Uncharacterized protein n=1 Tax=Papiliotrema laurentii TaxID=5418 RepID=A0AAD9CVY8_PAPLA|nr:hypothetical protein DB88DRAFT_512041 [Papiliotrema laurentii]